VIWQFPKDLFW